MSLINKPNAEKLLASTRLGLDIWIPEVLNEIETKVAIAVSEVENVLSGVTNAKHIVNPSSGYIVTLRPLKTVILYVECFTNFDGSPRWGKFGADLIDAERIFLGDGRAAQIPHISLRILHDGWRSEIIRAPLGFVCNGDHVFQDATVVYEHRYFTPVEADRVLISKEETNLIYVGMTKKTWASRWKEHLYSAQTGSPYDFHEAIRQFEGRHHSMHTVLTISQYWDEAVKWEEIFVAERSLRPKGLNMIPGGKAGIAFAAKYGVMADTPRRWEQREKVIKQIQQNAKKKGLPNPAQSLRLANDPNLMRKMIEGRDDTFHSNDIAVIRSMHARSVTWREIAQQLNVKDIYRVRDVVEGKTYKFVS